MCHSHSHMKKPYKETSCQNLNKMTFSIRTDSGRVESHLLPEDEIISIYLKIGYTVSKPVRPGVHS